MFEAVRMEGECGVKARSALAITDGNCEREPSAAPIVPAGTEASLGETDSLRLTLRTSRIKLGMSQPLSSATSSRIECLYVNVHVSSLQ